MDVSVGYNVNINGLHVVTDKHLTESKFGYPQHRFVEYDKSDEWWLCKYGFGEYYQAPSETVYQIGDMLVMHPDILARIVPK